MFNSSLNTIISKFYIIVNILFIFNLINLNALSREEKIGDLFIVPIYPLVGEEGFAKARKLIKKNKIGNVIFMGGDSQTQKKWIQILKNENDKDLWIFQDGEWGPGMRLKDIRPLPKNMTLGAIEDYNLLYAFGLEVAKECRSVGLNGNFAPIVDINSNSNNPVIGMRSFGDDPLRVSEQGIRVMRGFQDGGLVACAKHFPGHGDTHVDSHHSLPIIDKTLEQLEELELIPFQRLIGEGVDMVMVGHLSLPKIDSLPASLSKKIMIDLLREKMGFQGLIVTDALNMDGLSKEFLLQDSVTLSLQNGADLALIATADQLEYLDLIERQIQRAIEHVKNTLSDALVNEKTDRINRIKNREQKSKLKEQIDLRRSLYRAAVTQIGECPLPQGAIALVQSKPDPDFEAYLSRYTDVHCFNYDQMKDGEKFSTVLISVRKGDRPKNVPLHATIALFDIPYTLNTLNYNSALIGYEDVPEAKEAVADCLFKKLTPLGKLPITLSNRK